MANEGIDLVVDGVKYTIDLDEMTPRDARDFRRLCGDRMLDAIDAPDLDHVAAFVWLQRRRLEPLLTFAEVADGFTLGSLSDPRKHDAATPAPGAASPASGEEVTGSAPEA